MHAWQKSVVFAVMPIGFAPLTVVRIGKQNSLEMEELNSTAFLLKRKRGEGG